MTRFARIEGTVQAYQWGGYHFIPQLLSKDTSNSSQPSAEYWVGSHPSAPSTVIGSNESVVSYLDRNTSPPLNFLFKILDVKEMLSIQSHPTKEQARQGFENENRLGIDLTAKNRNYKDDSDKPELMVALSSFWLLHGIKPIVEIETLLSQKTYLSPLLDVLKSKSLNEAFRYALDSSNESVQQMHKHLISDCRDQNEHLSKDSIYFWIHNWASKNPEVSSGILTLFFLNLVHLNKGQAIYQPAGLLHAYLEGQNIELMANSDNVLRAGLTPKYIDIEELLKTCRLSSSQPSDFIIETTHHDNIIQYPTPFEQFQLEEVTLQSHGTAQWQTQHPEILFSYEGSSELTFEEGDPITLTQGEAIVVLPNTQVSIRSQKARIFKARNR